MQCPKAKPSSGIVVGFLRGKEVSIWKAKDVTWLRREWRIVGGLSGSLPLQPRQNIQLGLPLTLISEEAALLVDQGVLEVREYSSPEPAGEAERVAFSELREEECARQLSVYCERRERARREFVTMETCPEGVEVEREECEVVTSHKRAKLESSLVDAKSDSSGLVPAAAGVEGGRKNVASFSPLVCIHTADPRIELCPSCFPMAELNYPETETEVLRYRVFCDLWKKGNYITSGVKYGGDYLIYPGDPSLVHSHYVAIVLPWQQPIPSLVASGRLGSKVKKNILFCSVCPEGMIKYFTLQWAALS